MRSVVGKDGRTYRVPDNRGGKATRGASGASKGSASKGSKGAAGAVVYEVEEWRGKGKVEGGVISRHKTLAAAKRAAKAHAMKRDASWRIEVHKNEPRHAGESSSSSKGLGARVSALESVQRQQGATLTTLSHHVGAHDLALSALSKAAESRWSLKVPGFPKRGRS